MPITNIKDEREIVKKGLAEGKSPEFIRAAVQKYRQTISPPAANGFNYDDYAPKRFTSVPLQDAKPVSSLPQGPNFIDKLSSTATGFTKGLAEGALGIARGAVGTAKMLTAAGRATVPGVTYGEAKSQIDEKLPDFLVSSTPTGQKLDETLKSDNKYETYGKVLEFAGETFLTGGEKLVAPALGKTAKTLEIATLRLTGAQLRKLGTEAVSVAGDTMVKYGANVGSVKSRAAKFKDIYDGFEDNLQNAFEKVGDAFSVPKKKLLSGLDKLKGQFQGKSSEFQAVKKQIDRAKQNINLSFPGPDIPGSKLNNIKRDVFRTKVYNKAGIEVIDDVSFAIGNTMYGALKEAGEKSGLRIGVASLEEFNKEYEKIILTKTFLEQAVGRPELGILTRIAATIAGGGAGQAIGGAPAAAAGIIASQAAAKAVLGTAAKSTVSGALQFGKKASGKAVESLNSVVPGFGTGLAEFSAPAAASQTAGAVNDFLFPKKGERKR